jgi:hypothetical protein
MEASVISPPSDAIAMWLLEVGMSLLPVAIRRGLKAQGSTGGRPARIERALLERRGELRA